MYKIGDRVVLTESAKENYSDYAWVDDVLVVVDIATCIEEHPGYDCSMGGMQLMSFETVEGEDVCCSLYGYEVVS